LIFCHGGNYVLHRQREQIAANHQNQKWSLPLLSHSDDVT
jgi:hypothetical protein